MLPVKSNSSDLGDVIKQFYMQNAHKEMPIRINVGLLISMYALVTKNNVSIWYFCQAQPKLQL